jgi:hypothetical protein
MWFLGELSILEQKPTLVLCVTDMTRTSLILTWRREEMIKRPVYPINRKSWFPVKLKYEDQEEPCLVSSPYHLRDGVRFKVLDVRVVKEEKS